MKRSCVCLLLFAPLYGADIKVVAPPSATVVGPYSPGLKAGDFLYVSGQGAQNAERKFADNPEQQTLDTLKNIQAIVEAAGLTLEHVVYMQVYVKDPAAYEAVDRAWKKVFAKNSPARSVLGVNKMPTDTPIEINAIAVTELSRKKPVSVNGWPADSPAPAAVLAGDRVFLSGMMGRDWKTGQVPEDPAAQVQTALNNMGEVLKAAGLDFKHVVFTNPYLTDKMPMDVMNRVYAKHFEFGNTPARATIRVFSLPAGAAIEFTGVAARDVAQRVAVRPKNMDPSPTASPCVFVGDTFYCSAKSGFIPGPQSGIYAASVEHQVRQTMRNLLDGLQEAGLSFSNVVATNVYLDDLDEFTKMNGVYAEYFTTVKPTRTTVQPIAPVERKADERGRHPKLEEISLIAVK
jgi:2-iminobutanoate/2-iminopropanoate deaminase